MEDAHDAAVIHEDQQPPGILPSFSRILSDHRESSSSSSSAGRIPDFPHNEDFISLSQDIQHESQSYYVDTTGVFPTSAELTAAFMCPPTLDEMMIQVRELRLQRTSNCHGRIPLQRSYSCSNFFPLNNQSESYPTITFFVLERSNLVYHRGHTLFHTISKRRNCSR
jgi:hypothetical protein